MADKPLQSLTIQGLSDTYVNTPLSIAPEFNPDTDYEYGDYVFYNRKLYKYIQDQHSAGPWNEDNFEEITVGSDIKGLVNDTTVAFINFSNAINDIDLSDRIKKGSATGSIILGDIEHNSAQSYSVAEGKNTVASGAYSHAEGNFANAVGEASHCEGYNTHAYGKYQHVFGKNNLPDQLNQYVEIVGNGKADVRRSNARTLDWDGNEVLAGKLTVGTAPTADMDVATKQYVDTSMTNIGDDKVDKSAIDNAGITNITYETMFGGEFTVTTTATTENGQTAYAGNVSVTGTIDKTKVYSVTMNGTEYIVSARLADVGGDPLFYLGNIEMPPVDAGIIDEIDNVPFFIGFPLSSQILSISTSEPGEYTFLIKQINYESKPIPRTLIYGDNYKPITVVHDDDNHTTSGFSIGVNKLTSADGTFAIGYGNEIGSYGGVAIGEDNIVNSGRSLAEGYSNIIENDRDDYGCSHVEGMNNEILGIAIHMEGQGNYASTESLRSHVEGANNKVYGECCHVEGVCNEAYINGIHISGAGSYIEQPFPEWMPGGQETETSHIYDVGSCVMYHDKSYICVEENSDATWDYSKWRPYPSNGRAAFVIGNSSDVDLIKSNAAMIDWSGNMYLGGDVYVGCDNTSNNGNKLMNNNDVLNYLDTFSGMSIPSIIPSSEISYNQGFIGRYNDEYYICNVDGSQFAYPIDTSKWSKAPNDIVLRMLNSAVVKSNVIANPYIADNKISYNVDDVVLYNNRLYFCNEDGVSGEFDSSKWTEMTVGACLENLRQVIITLDDDLNHKANKVLNATSGNFASLTSSGDIEDSGKKASDFVGFTDYATSNQPGVIKYGQGLTINSNNQLQINKALDDAIKNGTNEYQPIVPVKQHISTFYGLAKAAGDTTQSASNNAVGVYTDEAKSAIQTMLGVPSTDDVVTDVQVNGTSILNQGVAEIPIANAPSKLGLVYAAGGGVTVQSDGRILVQSATDAEIKGGSTGNKPIIPSTQHISTFYGLAKAAGADMASSNNAVGTYTDEAKVAIKSMLGVNDVVTDVTVSGTTPTITAVTNTRYICGEVATLDFTPSSTGICDVIFESGSTATVLTLPSTVKMPEWFDATTLEANTIYEISIIDGVYGAVMSWQA